MRRSVTLCGQASSEASQLVKHRRPFPLRCPSWRADLHLRRVRPESVALRSGLVGALLLRPHSSEDPKQGRGGGTCSSRGPRRQSNDKFVRCLIQSASFWLEVAALQRMLRTTAPPYGAFGPRPRASVGRRGGGDGWADRGAGVSGGRSTPICWSLPLIRNPLALVRVVRRLGLCFGEDLGSAQSRTSAEDGAMDDPHPGRNCHRPMYGLHLKA